MAGRLQVQICSNSTACVSCVEIIKNLQWRFHSWLDRRGGGDECGEDNARVFLCCSTTWLSFVLSVCADAKVCTAKPPLTLPSLGVRTAKSSSIPLTFSLLHAGPWMLRAHIPQIARKRRRQRVLCRIGILSLKDLNCRSLPRFLLFSSFVFY